MGPNDFEIMVSVDCMIIIIIIIRFIIIIIITVKHVISDRISMAGNKVIPVDRW